MMQMQVMSFNRHPKIYYSTQRAICSPPLLEVFIILNEKDAEKGQGKGEMGEWRGRSDTKKFYFMLFLVGTAINALGCLPRSACLRSLA